MPRVVHVTTVHRTFDNRIFLKECASLRDNGWDVHLVARHDRDEVVDGISIHALPQVSSRASRIRELPPIARRIATELEPDIIHFHDPELLPLASSLAAGGWNCIYDMHENIVKDVLTKRWINPLMRPLVSAYMRFKLRSWLRDLHVVFAEESYAADYPQARHHCTVLNMPRMEQLLEVKVEKRALPTLAYIGGVGIERGSLTMLRALSILQGQEHEVGLLMIGPAEPGHQAEINELIAESGIRNVEQHGFTRADVARPMIASCHIGLAVLEARPNYVNSYPTKIFEYMGLGLPVVSSDFELYRGIVEGNSAGLCVPPDDPKALAEAIGSLLSDSRKAQKMGNAGREAAASRFNWANEEGKLLEFYSEVMS